jgi:hypothetical protein
VLGGYLTFIYNCHSWVLEKIRMKEWPVQVIWKKKNSESRSPSGSGYFKNLKESLGVAKEPEKNLEISGWSSGFFEKLGNCVVIG